MFQSAALVPGPDDPHATLLALRARAEQYRHLVTQHPFPEIPADTQRLVQELQVHQIELEMQNEELPVRLHLTGLEQRLALPVEIAVYRVVQELLNNAMKHARATEVVVHLGRGTIISFGLAV